MDAKGPLGRDPTAQVSRRSMVLCCPLPLWPCSFWHDSKLPLRTSVGQYHDSGLCRQYSWSRRAYPCLERRSEKSACKLDRCRVAVRDGRVLDGLGCVSLQLVLQISGETAIVSRCAMLVAESYGLIVAVCLKVVGVVVSRSKDDDDDGRGAVRLCGRQRRVKAGRQHGRNA